MRVFGAVFLTLMILWALDITFNQAHFTNIFLRMLRDMGRGFGLV